MRTLLVSVLLILVTFDLVCCFVQPGVWMKVLAHLMTTKKKILEKNKDAGSKKVQAIHDLLVKSNSSRDWSVVMFRTDKDYYVKYCEGKFAQNKKEKIGLLMSYVEKRKPAINTADVVTLIKSSSASKCGKKGKFFGLSGKICKDRAPIDIYNMQLPISLKSTCQYVSSAAIIHKKADHRVAGPAGRLAMTLKDDRRFIFYG